MTEHRDTDLHVMPMVRMPMIALGIIASLWLFSIITTTVVWGRTSARTDDVDNTIASLRVLGDLQSDVARLATATPANLAERETTVMNQLRIFEPLVTPFERREWQHMREVLEHVIAVPLDAPDRVARLERLEDSLDRLAEINTRNAARAIDRIHEAHGVGLILEILEGIVVVVVAGSLALVLTRVMRRQRGLIERDLSSLQERNRELDAFAYRTAHDLRGPLGPIITYAELVAAGAPVEASRAAQKIRAAANTMAAIIENLLSLSAFGRLPLGEAEPSRLVHEVVGGLHSELADAKVDIDVDEGKAACSPNVLAQLLRNVITNASKYRSNARPLTLSIHGRPVGRCYEITIADNGIGMSPAAARRAFEEHFRAEDSIDRPGHGLGLAIVKRTVEAVGGDVELRSEPDVGTTVMLRLPLG